MEEKRRPGRPKTDAGPTPKRNIRIGDVWDQAETLAHRDGETMTKLVTRLLHQYVDQKRT